MSLQAAAEDGQGGSSSYGDGEIVPPLGSEGEEALQSGLLYLGSVCLPFSQSFPAPQYLSYSMVTRAAHSTPSVVYSCLTLIQY